MRKTINVPPPSDFASFTPSELFKFFFQIGRWTEDRFSDELQAFTRGRLVSTVTISKWKNRDVLPTRYAGPFLKLIENAVEPGLAKAWTTAFETVWALHSAGRTQNKAKTKPPSVSNAICDQHKKWIRQRYAEKRPGELFSPSDIYVPLQFSEACNPEPHPQDAEDLISLLTRSENTPADADWIFISGGPGAGKSMSALHLANQLCEEDSLPIYIRGRHLSDIDIDILDPNHPIGDSFSARSFLKFFRSSNFETACLILDGLGEIDKSSRGSAGRLSKFIAELKTEQTVCNTHNKILRVIGFGRDSDVHTLQNQFPAATSRHFKLLGLDGQTSDSHSHVMLNLGEDLRPIWWHKYLTATDNFIDPSLPDFLTSEFDDFSEFGSNPLLTYLICHTALEPSEANTDRKLPHERVNALAFAANKNQIYKAIIERLAKNVRHILDAESFLSVLQHSAITTWHHADGGSVSLKTVYNSIRDEETKAAFRALNLSDTSSMIPADMLITGFTYHLSQQDLSSEQNEIGFTHKTFAEYLVSTCLFDCFARLISAFGNKSDFETELEDWARLSCAGHHGPSLAAFCQKEAAQRFEVLSRWNWDSALTIIQSHIKSRHFQESGVLSLSQMQQACSLLFFIWSCLNLERLKRTGTYFQLRAHEPQFDISDFKSIQRPNALNFELGAKIEPVLRHQTFLTPSLSALHLTSADMSQLSFSLGHIESLICEDCNFAMTHWSHVKTTQASFKRTLFQHAIFHQWRLIDTQFTNCLFQASRFQGAAFSTCHFEDTFFSQCHFSEVEFLSSQLESVIFDRCIFAQCDFARLKDRASLMTTKFRHCTFIDMENAIEAIPSENMENAIFRETKTTQSPHAIFREETKFDKLL